MSQIVTHAAVLTHVSCRLLASLMLVCPCNSPPVPQSNLNFPYPCTIAWMGLLTTTLASYVWCRVMLPERRRYLMTSRQYTRAVLPTGFFMAVTFQTGNMVSHRPHPAVHVLPEVTGSCCKLLQKDAEVNAAIPHKFTAGVTSQHQNKLNAWVHTLSFQAVSQCGSSTVGQRVT